MGVNDQVLDSIQTIVSNSIKNAGYDKTIQAQVVSCQDATIGKYRCRYQDAVFYAYSNNPSLMIANNALVYILIPNGDFKQDKTILGTTQKLGIDYLSEVTGEDAYQQIGINCMDSSNRVYYLNSENANYNYVLYRYADKYDSQHGTYAVGDYTMYNGNLYQCTAAVTSPQAFNSNRWAIIENENLDIESLEQYIKQSSSIIFGATFKTSIPAMRQYEGHYGLRFNLAFIDNASGNTVIRSYEVNEDNMVGNPYRLAYPTRQYQIFDVDGQNFLRVDTIEIFNKDFPNTNGSTSTGKLNTGDIQISNLELTNALHLSESQLNGVAITFYTPQGTFFTDRSTTGDQKKIVAQVKVKGKVVSSSQNIDFYWGKENVNVTASSLSYNKHLGRGWECLNRSNVIQGNENVEPIVEWVPGSDTYVVNYDQATAQDNRFKLAIVYNGTVVTKEINIKNLGATVFNVRIESDSGTKFYFDNGHPNLTCIVTIEGEDQPSGNYHFYWAYQSSEGIFNELPQTTTDNNTYNTAKNIKESIESDISQGIKFREIQRDNLLEQEKILNSYKFIQRVEGNHVYDVQIKNITKFGTFKCSVFNSSNVYCGTASITLTNSYDAEGVYSLVINNGAVVFKYDEKGFAPTNGSLDNPQQIQALSFTVYDNLGNALDSNEIITSPRCSVEWGFPNKDTLLRNPTAINGNPNGRIDATEKYVYYKKVPMLAYEIVDNYNQNRKVNQITLDVDYKGMKLSTQTQFTFVKEGEPGTNGTDYIIKLIPNTIMDNPPSYPIVTTTASGKHYLNYGIGTTNAEEEISIGPGSGHEYQFFRVRIYKNGIGVWEGFQAGLVSISNQYNDGVTIPSAVHWQVLQNTYKRKNLADQVDESNFGFSQDGTLDGNIYYKGTHLNIPVGTQPDTFTSSRANIIKCSITIGDKIYYGTIPITTAWVSDEKYRVSLKDYTGFRYVVYTSDGMNPQYDSSYPFEFVCKEKINNATWSDISTVSGTHALTYNFNVCSDIWTTIVQGTSSSFGKANQNLLTMSNRSVYHLADNEVRCEPIERYDGFCVNAAVLCQYTQNNTVIGRINVPIHFLLNKYGFANLNDWDGNHIQINNQDQQGYILAPQVGAGKKDDNNGFTGVLMGTLTRTDNPRDKTKVGYNEDIGLMGFSNGDRSFFLNSKNGSAIFGKGRGGKIIIDPSDEIEQIVEGTTTVQVPRNRALLYSDSFWANYDEDGLPTSYYHTNYSSPGAGMLIDLSTPQIRWGNGNFSVNENGHLVAQGGGQIAGWVIGDYALTSKYKISSTYPSLTLYSGSEGDSLGGRIYSGRHTALTDSHDGFYLSKDGLSIGSKFKVTSDGIVSVGKDAVEYDHNADDATLRYSLRSQLVGDGTSSGRYVNTGEEIFSQKRDITILVEFEDGGTENSFNQLFNAYNNKTFKGLLAFSESDGLTLYSPPYSTIERQIRFSYTRSSSTNTVFRLAYTYHPTSSNSQFTFNFSINGNRVSSGIVKNLVNGTTTTQSTPIVLQGGAFEKNIEQLCIGYRQLTDSSSSLSYWKGTIKKFYVYYDDLKDTTFINNFLDGGDIPNNQYLSRKHWVINTNSNNGESYIAYNTSTFQPAEDDNNTRMYFGTDGLSLGKSFFVSNYGDLRITKGSIKLGQNIQTSPSTWNFSVNNRGYLEAQSGKIAGIEMWKHGDVSELRAGTKDSNNNNKLTKGFVFQSTGRVLGIGTQYYDTDQGNVLYNLDLMLYYLMPESTTAQQQAKAEKWNEIQTNISNHYYQQPSYNIWAFNEDSGIFQGGTSDWYNGNYRIQNQHFRIQPANGFAKFMYVDVVEALTVGGVLRGTKNNTYNGISRFQNIDQTYFIESSNGHAGFSQISVLGKEIKGFTNSSMTGQTFYIDSSNGYARFKNISLDPNGSRITGPHGQFGIYIDGTGEFQTMRFKEMFGYSSYNASGTTVAERWASSGYFFHISPVNEKLWVRGGIQTDGKVICNEIESTVPIYAVFG